VFIFISGLDRVADPLRELIAFLRSGSATISFNLAVQRATRMVVWAEPMVKLRLPLIYNLRRDPFERADINSNSYFDWMVAQDGSRQNGRLHSLPYHSGN
jgi:hypothetical protein